MRSLRYYREHPVFIALNELNAMLPNLNRTPQIEQDVLNYLQALKK